MNRKDLEGKPQTYKVIAYNVLLIATIVILWELAASFVNSRFFPRFSDVVKAFMTIATVGDIEGHSLFAHSVASVLRVLAGFALAFATGFPVGLLMGLKPLIYSSSRSFLEPVRFIPPIAWIPLAIILLTGYSRYIFIIWLGAFFPILLNTIIAVKRTSPVLIEVAKTFGAKKASTISKVVVPSASPEVAVGMRIGLGIGWMCIVAAEMIGAEPIGLGRFILNSAQLLRVDMIVAGMISIGLIGLLMNEIFLQTEKRVFRWRREVKV